MKYLLYFLLAGTALAQQAVVDPSGYVLAIGRASLMNPGPDTSVVACDRTTDPTTLQDAFGRCQYKVVAGVLTGVVAHWTASSGFNGPHKRTLLDAIDRLMDRKLGLERWQTDYGAVYDRSAELAAVNALLTASKNALIGP